LHALQGIANWDQSETWASWIILVEPIYLINEISEIEQTDIPDTSEEHDMLGCFRSEYLFWSVNARDALQN
jgi:hypothetical protein